MSAVASVTEREPFINSQQGAAFLGFNIDGDRARALRAFRAYVRRRKIPHYRRGRTLLFLRSELDEAVRRDQLERVAPRMIDAQIEGRKRA
jgi:hypothetical protein